MWHYIFHKKEIHKFLQKKSVKFARAILINMTLIVIFSLIYINMKDHFVLISDPSKEVGILDCVLTATTVQAKVGTTNMRPTTPTSKIIMIMHQIIMLIAYIFAFMYFII